MNTRLLSFLTSVESALADSSPPLADAEWENSRTVNYLLGLAKLDLAALPPNGERSPLGSMHLKHYRLADGSNCLKATLKWHGIETNASHTIYDLPSIDWSIEARQLASEWQRGRPAIVSHHGVPHDKSQRAAS